MGASSISRHMFMEINGGWRLFMLFCSFNRAPPRSIPNLDEACEAVTGRSSSCWHLRNCCLSSPFVVIQSACGRVTSSPLWLTFLRTTRPGWTCGCWRPSWASVTSPTRATTAAGRPSPRSTRCLTLPTWWPLRPPLTTRGARTRMSSASRRESASSDRRRAELLQGRGDTAVDARD